MRDKFKNEWSDHDVVIAQQPENTETEEERTKDEMDSELESMDEDMDGEDAGEDGGEIDADTKKLEEQFNAHQGGIGWKQVRHVPSGTHWHPAVDRLQGTQVYGDPADGSQPWSIQFDDIRYNEFKFSTFDQSLWLVASVNQVIGQNYDSQPRLVESSSDSEVAYNATWMNRASVQEDPTISLRNYKDCQNRGACILYSEAGNSSPSSIQALKQHGGADVYVRWNPKLYRQQKAQKEAAEAARKAEEANRPKKPKETEDEKKSRHWHELYDMIHNKKTKHGDH